MAIPCRAFCCYAGEDEVFLRDLKKHLMPLQREGLLNVQADIDISPGKVREQEIAHYLESADIILLLISPDFIASDYCFNREMRQAIVRHEQGTARVVLLIIRPTAWHGMPFGKLQALPKDAIPVSISQDRDTAFLNITKGIRTVVQELATNSSANWEQENPSWSITGEDSSPANHQERRNMDTTNKSSEVNFNGPVSGQQVIGSVTGGQVIGVQHITHIGDQKDGLRSLDKGSKALWNGDYPSAKRELRIAIEEIDQDARPREASRAYCFFALALLSGKLPRIQTREIIKTIDERMNSAIRIYPCASYYRIFACIKKDFYVFNGFDHHLDEVYDLERKGASVPRCEDDEDNEEYFRRCQPRLQI